MTWDNIRLNAIKLVIIRLVCLMWLASGCVLGGQGKWDAQIDQAEATWQQQGVDSYKIEVLVIRSIWHGQSHQITVVNGEVVSEYAECFPAPIEAGKCEVEDFNAEDYTIPGLFAIARSEAQIEEGQFTKIDFDPTYGFPSRISYDDPDVFDEDRSWKVVSFEVSEILQARCLSHEASTQTQFIVRDHSICAYGVAGCMPIPRAAKIYLTARADNNTSA
jgi:hypothetical protein